MTWNPPISLRRALLAAALFLAVLGATSVLLWRAHELSMQQQALGASGLILLLCLIGRLTQPGTAVLAPPVIAGQQ